MPEKYAFFDSVGGDRVYNAQSFCDYMKAVISDGILPTPSTSLQVMANTSDYNIKVSAGSAWIRGHLYQNTDDLILSVDIADGTLNRKDLVVVQLDETNRLMRSYIKKGTPSANPVAPSVANSSTIREIALAEINVNKGVISISQGNIVDVRMDTSRGGWVNSLIQADTTTIFNQFQGWFDTKTVEYEGDFNGWFVNTKAEWDSWYQNWQDQLANDDHTQINQRISDLETHTTNQDQTMGNLVEDVGLKAPIDNPVFTGVPKVNASSVEQEILHKGNVPSSAYKKSNDVPKFSATTNSSSLNKDANWNRLPFNTVAKDTDAGFSAGGNSYTIKTAGTWLIGARLRHSFSAANLDFRLAVYVNGVHVKTIGEAFSSGASSIYSIGDKVILDLNQNDVVTIWYNLGGTSALNLFNSAPDTFFEGILLYASN